MSTEITYIDAGYGMRGFARGTIDDEPFVAVVEGSEVCVAIGEHPDDIAMGIRDGWSKQCTLRGCMTKDIHVIEEDLMKRIIDYAAEEYSEWLKAKDRAEKDRRHAEYYGYWTGS